MLAIFRIFSLSSLTKMHKKKALIKICSDLKNQSLKSLDLSFFNAPKTPRPLTGLKRSIEMINAIEKTIVYVALADSDF